jgi:hypothetical protein
MLLRSQGDLDAARAGLEAFEELCTDESWRGRARAMLKPSIDTQPAGGDNAGP